MNPIVLSVTEHVRKECLTEYLELVNAVADAMRHESTFRYLFVGQDPTDPTRFNYFEAWEDRAEFYEVQMKRAYRNRFEERIPAMLKTPRSIVEWNPLRDDFAFFSNRSQTPYHTLKQ